MNKSLLTIIWSILMLPDLSAQSKMGFENYNYLGKGSGSIVPMINFESRNNWHAEVRYNYEDINTVSAFGGKTLSGGKGLSFSITPMAGFSAGTFNGVSFAANTDFEWKNFFLSAQSQQSFGFKANNPGFFFNWSELGYSITDNFYAGTAIQYTRQEGINSTDHGFFAGVEFRNISIPVYLFKPGKESYWVLGLTYEIQFKTKIKRS
jgi:hypothetical protein